MKYTIDTHTHTLVSGHAYNTIDEMAALRSRYRSYAPCDN